MYLGWKDATNLVDLRSWGKTWNENRKIKRDFLRISKTYWIDRRISEKDFIIYDRKQKPSIHDRRSRDLFLSFSKSQSLIVYKSCSLKQNKCLRIHSRIQEGIGLRWLKDEVLTKWDLIQRLFIVLATSIQRNRKLRKFKVKCPEGKKSTKE